MVHVFNFKDNYYIFDTGSSSLHECDEKCALILREKLGETVDTSAITPEERKEYEADLAELQAQGLLFAEEVKAYPVKSNEVKALCLHICHEAIDFLIENSGNRKILETDFFGGEPLMNFDVVKETVYYAKEQAAKRGKKFLFTLTTNGLLLKDDVAQFLNEEMENVVLSLDGRKEVHDAVRKTANGKGSFDLVIENIKNFVKIRGDKSYYVRGTFTAKNLDFGKDVLFLADNGFDSISMEPVVTDIPDLEITKDMLPAVCAEYDRLCDATSSISTSIWRAAPALPSA